MFGVEDKHLGACLAIINFFEEKLSKDNRDVATDVLMLKPSFRSLENLYAMRSVLNSYVDQSEEDE